MLKRLFSRGSPLRELRPIEEPARLAEELGPVMVHVLQVPVPEGFDPSGLSEEEFGERLMAQLEEAGEALASSAQLELYSFESDGSRTVPAFSTERGAQRFAQELVTRMNRVLPFALGEGPVGAVTAQLPAGAKLVIDPGTSDEWALSPSQMAALAERWG